MEKLKEYKHVILTRFNTQAFDGKLIYDKPIKEADGWMWDRMKLFAKTRESVLDQGEDFLWVVGIDERTPFHFRDEIKGDEPRIRWFEGDVRQYFDAFPVEEPWLITTRLDNDDLHKPGAIKAIQDCFTHKEIIIDLVYHQKKGRDLFESNRPNPNGPFLSLIEKNDKAIRTCYARPHNKMSEDWKKAIFASREPLAYMVIHGDNAANKIVGRRVL